MPRSSPAQPLDWRPTASHSALQARARLLAAVREFFAVRGVLEVETPLLSAATVPDPAIESFSTRYRGPGPEDERQLWLQTSPELAMKRLLADGCGAIFQICKAFRQGEAGRWHNPEFTILEWYRLNYDHHDLMDEVAALLQATLDAPPAERISYRDLFTDNLKVDPLTCSTADLAAVAERLGLQSPVLETCDEWLDLLMTHCLEPRIGRSAPLFVFDYPASQASLARIRTEESPHVAERFELYWRGFELANGFHELVDAGEQRRRFQSELVERRERNLPAPPLDRRFLAALESGLPPCSGVAVGFDRLLMLLLGTDSLSEVLAFPLERA